jgi:phosphatidyl-myo-inositol dimannoside synthase
MVRSTQTKVMVKALADPRVLLSAQFLAAGNGGICAVARLTAIALSGCGPLRALACQDNIDHYVGATSVRAFRNHRILFVLSNLNECRLATHVIYDFAGTARAHPNIPFLQRPYAVWIHGWEVWPGAPRKYLQALRGASLVLANSAYTLRRAGAMFPTGLDVRICPLGTFDDSSPATVGPSNGPPTVMLLGRADELFAKGHDVLIGIWPRIISAVPDARLLLVGGGSALDKVRGLAAASPARAAIEVVGFVPEERLEGYWQRATVFAMLSFAEGFGLVYVEAMRHGLPVIASINDAAQEVNVDGVTGFNIARSDSNRLTEILIALLRERDYARRLGAAGHACWRQKYAFSSFSQRLRATTAEFLAT